MSISIDENFIELVRSASQEADRLTGCKKSARAERILDELLPAPISLGGRARAYLGYELQSVAEARAKGLSDDGIRRVVRHLARLRGTCSVSQILEDTREYFEELVTADAYAEKEGAR